MATLHIENIDPKLIENYALISDIEKQQINDVIETILKQKIKKTSAQKADVVFNLLTELSDDFMENGRNQLPLQTREEF